MVKQALKVTVLSVTDVVFEGEVVAISSINSRGPFDVLPLHSQFISLIEKEVTLHHESGEKTVYELVRGVMRVLRNEVKVFLGIEGLGSADKQV